MDDNIKRKLVLLILDGLGIAPESNVGNAVTLAETPNLDNLKQKFPYTELEASGVHVGLPENVCGNSEIGHMSIGAGRLIKQELVLINESIKNGEFFRNKILEGAFFHAKKYKSNIHLMGLLSDGSVHSNVNHLIACLDYFKNKNFSDEIFIHAFTDGRDTSPKSAEKYFKIIEDYISLNKIGKLTTVIGRYYSMDRDNDWSRTKKAYDLIVNSEGTAVNDWRDILDISYNKNITDEFFDAYKIGNKRDFGNVNDDDVIIFFNYRGDRAVQLSRSFEDKGFSEFKVKGFKNLYFVGFSNYNKGDNLTGEIFPTKQVFGLKNLKFTLGEMLSKNGLRQLRLSESEKYPHVTYFFNGLKSKLFDFEDRIEVPSPDVPTYDLKPEMSNYEVTEKLIEAIKSNSYNFILCNFATPDMVGHTGNLQAGIRAVEVVDECLGEVFKVCKDLGYDLIVTADHGNVEEMIDLDTGKVNTQHSTNKVPFLLITNKQYKLRENGGSLNNIAPTVLDILDIKKESEMSFESLILNNK